MKVLLFTFALISCVALIKCGIVFTGHADEDFKASNPSFANDNQVGAIGAFLSETSYGQDAWMASQGYYSGMDIDYIRTFYDYRTDELHVGIECNGICGDTDGNGNAGTTSYGYPDDIDGCGHESFSIMWWNNVPTDYETNGDPGYFLPTIITGDSLADCIVDFEGDGAQHFLAYQFPNYEDVQWPTPRDNPDDVDYNNQRNIVLNPSVNGYDHSLEINSLYPSIPQLKLHVPRPNITSPHLEFTLKKFSKYPENEYLLPLGHGTFRTGLSAFALSDTDNYGEDLFYPTIYQFTYDCKHIPNGPNVYDQCGVCGGDSTSCADCEGTVGGTVQYDDCGICGGNGTSCIEVCEDYLGFDLEAVDYALLRWSVSASLNKINDTLKVLKSIKQSLNSYDYENGEVSLNDYIDVIHEFCDNCLDNFDNAQLWFSEVLSGACEGINCDSPFSEQEQVRWSL